MKPNLIWGLFASLGYYLPPNETHQICYNIVTKSLGKIESIRNGTATFATLAGTSNSANVVRVYMPRFPDPVTISSSPPASCDASPTVTVTYSARKPPTATITHSLALRPVSRQRKDYQYNSDASLLSGIVTISPILLACGLLAWILRQTTKARHLRLRKYLADATTALTAAQQALAEKETQWLRRTQELEARLEARLQKCVSDGEAAHLRLELQLASITAALMAAQRAEDKLELGADMAETQQQRRVEDGEEMADDSAGELMGTAASKRTQNRARQRAARVARMREGTEGA
ncbi:hypothetical protein LTR08_003510 [Meristemomyces frigidus]|nr:hypothetical protein LTR08_003510 [Meristemomyces frigidus]